MIHDDIPRPVCIACVSEEESLLRASNVCDGCKEEMWCMLCIVECEGYWKGNVRCNRDCEKHVCRQCIKSLEVWNETALFACGPNGCCAECSGDQFEMLETQQSVGYLSDDEDCIKTPDSACDYSDVDCDYSDADY